MTLKADAAGTSGGLGVMHVHALRGAGSPVHEHRDEDESWYVLEGTLRFWLGEEEHVAAAGDFIFGPRGIAHRFLVESDESRFLMLVTPGGFEGFVRATGTPATTRRLPAPSHPAHADAEVGAAVLRYGLTITAPHGPA